MEYDDFRNMSVWQKSVEIVVKVYEVTRTYPTEEKFGLIPDMRRAANSISHNIAEACLPARQGYGRFEAKDKKRFYNISRGSCFELMSQYFVLERLRFLDNQDSNEIVAKTKEVIKELNSIIKTLETKK
ncbi:MAG: four helix bundle protein [Thiohalospira sp.]